MKSVFAPLAAALVLATGALAQLTVNTPVPNPVVCQPVLITWSGGTPPYFLSIQPGNQPTAAPLLDFGQQNGVSLTWTANFTAGTSLGLTIKDSTGQINNSGVFTIQAGSDTSCLTGTTPTTGAGGATSTPAGTSPPANTPTSTPANTPTSTPANTPTSAPASTGAGTTTAPTSTRATTTAANTTTTTPGSGALKTNAGFAGVFAAAAAVFAIAF